MKRKFIHLATSVTLAAALMTPIVVKAAPTYYDVPGHWAETQISKWSEKGVLSGYAGYFRPNDSMTRGDLAIVLDKIMKYQTTTQNSYKDLPQEAYYTPAVLRAAAAGVITADEGYIRANQNLTRQEAAVMVAKALNLAPASSTNADHSDLKSISSSNRGYVYAVLNAGYMNGHDDGTFEPNGKITRAQVMSIINNAAVGYYDQAKTYTGSVSGTAIVNTSGATLKDLTVNGDLVIAQGVGNGEVTLDNVKVSGTIYVRGGGSNSVIVKNSKLERVNVSKSGNSAVSIKLAPSAEIVNLVAAESEQKVNIQGKVGTVTAQAKSSVNLASATVTNVNVVGKNAVVTIGSGTTVRNLTVEKDASNTVLTVSGTVSSISNSAVSVSITVSSGGKVTTVSSSVSVHVDGSGTIGSTSGNVTVSGGNTTPTSEPTSRPSTPRPTATSTPSTPSVSVESVEVTSATEIVVTTTDDSLVTENFALSGGDTAGIPQDITAGAYDSVEGTYTLTVAPGLTANTEYTLTVSKTGATSYETVVNWVQEGTVSGTVTGKTGDGAGTSAGLQGVAVAVKAGNTTVKTATTAADGTYSIANVPIGTYTIEFSKTGYKTDTSASQSVAHGGNVTASKVLLSSATDMYSDDASIASVDNTAKTISVGESATFSQVAAKLSVQHGGTFGMYLAGDTIDKSGASEAISANDIVIATAEDGVTKSTYTFEVVSAEEMLKAAVQSTTIDFGTSANTIKIVGGATGMSYKVQGGSEVAISTNVVDNISISKTETITVYVTGNETTAGFFKTFTAAEVESKLTPAAAPTALLDLAAMTLTGTDETNEYSLDGGNTWTPCTATDTDLTDKTVTVTHGVKVRVAGTDDTVPGAIQTIAVTKAATPTFAIDYAKEETSTAVAETVTYRKSTDPNWDSGAAVAVAIHPGSTYEFKTKAVGSVLESDVQTLVAAARPAAPTQANAIVVSKGTAEGRIGLKKGTGAGTYEFAITDSGKNEAPDKDGNIDGAGNKAKQVWTELTDVVVDNLEAANVEAGDKVWYRVKATSSAFASDAGYYSVDAGDIRGPVPTVAPATITVPTDGDTATGKFSGKLTWEGAGVETGVTGYHVYWSTGANKSDVPQGATPVATVTVGGGSYEHTFANAAIPANVTGLIVVAYNGEGDAVTGTYADVTDVIPAQVTPTVSIDFVTESIAATNGFVYLVNAEPTTTAELSGIVAGGKIDISADIPASGSNYLHIQAPEKVVAKVGTTMATQSAASEVQHVVIPARPVAPDETAAIVVSKGTAVGTIGLKKGAGTGTYEYAITDISKNAAPDKNDNVGGVGNPAKQGWTTLTDSPVDSTTTVVATDKVWYRIKATENAFASDAGYYSVVEENIRGDVPNVVPATITVPTEDGDATAGKFSGTLTWTGAGVETDVTGYHVYWSIDENKSNLPQSAEPVATVAQGETYEYTFTNATIPENVTGLIVVAYNDEGDAVTGKYADVTDVIPAQATPNVSIDFAAESIAAANGLVYLVDATTNTEDGLNLTVADGKIDISADIPASGNNYLHIQAPEVTTAKNPATMVMATQSAASEVQHVVIPARPAAPTASEITAVSATVGTAGTTKITLTYTGGAYEIAIAATVEAITTWVEAGATTVASTEISATENDKVFIRVKATGSAFASDPYESHTMVTGEIGS